jgi:aminopeptidase N
MANMPGTNLTREEASERASIVSTETYDVQLDLTLDSDTHFGSVSTIRFGATAGASTFVDLVDGDISSITLNGDSVPVDAYDDHRIALTGLAETNESTRSTAGSTCTPSSRCPTPVVSSRRSSSPT